METRKWFNSFQPQTLQSALFLLYLRAVFGLIDLLSGNPLGIIQMAGAGAAYGIANDKKWGWFLALGTSGVALLLDLTLIGSFYGIIYLMFDILLLVLLLHPITRSYQKIYFK